jgi:membrane-bound inhibitor of C-type lysozyme
MIKTLKPQMNTVEHRWTVSQGNVVPIAIFDSLVTSHLCSSVFICGSLLFAVEAVAQPTSEAPVSVRYKCDNKQSLQVDYNIPGKTSRAIVTTSKPPSTGKMSTQGKATTTGKSATPAKTSWTMNQVTSGSGIRYEDAKNKMEWSSQGPAGQLTDLRTNKSINCTEYASSR